MSEERLLISPDVRVAVPQSTLSIYGKLAPLEEVSDHSVLNTPAPH